jgi:hypothetical protein
MVRGLVGLLAAGFVLISGMAIGSGWPVSAQVEPVEPALEINGVNTDELVGSPQTFAITANVTDSLGRAAIGLTEADFAITGDLAPFSRIIRVESFAADNLPISAALVLDISSSMAGAPFDRLKEAALTFIDTLRPGDSVAVIVFSSSVNVLLPFTADLDAARAAIAALPLGGETALHQAAFDAVAFTQGAPDPRRAIVLLSDGAEYGGRSRVTGEEALLEGLRAGIPVFSIGLGFGADRSFLETLSGVTNGRFYESPSPDELVSIFRTLGLLFTNQYLITAQADGLPLDGTVYPLTLTAQVEGRTVSATGLLRAPVPVPIVTLGEIPDPIAEPITISAQVTADDPVASASYTSSIPWDVPQPAGPTASIDARSRYDFPLDPRVIPPGAYPFAFTVTDSDGDSATAETTLSIPVLAPEIRIDGLTDGETISGDRVINLSFVSQSPISRVDWLINGAAVARQAAPPFSAQIPALRLGSGAYILTLQVQNETGGTTTRDIPFIIAPSVDQTRTALAPTPTFTPTFTPSNTATFTPSNTPTATFTPSDTPTATLTPSATFTPSDTPTATFTPSDTPTATLTPSATFTPSNTPTATFTPSDTPTATLTPSATFTPSDTPTATFTPSDTPTATFTPSDTFTPSPTFTPTIDLTVQMRITQTALLAETRAALATANAAARALGTATAESRIQTQVAFGYTATASANEQATAAIAATQRQATAIAARTEAAQQIIMMQGTLSALAATEARATADVATQIASTATQQAIADATITQIAVEMQQTEVARVTATAASVATATAQSVISTQAAEAQRIADATMTQIAAEILTRTAIAARTEIAARTQAAATATADAEQTAAAATAQAELTATAGAVQTATALPATEVALNLAATATGAAAPPTPTITRTPESTAEATEEATAEAAAETTPEPADAQTRPMPSLEVPSDPSGLVIACALMLIALSIIYVVLRLLVRLVFRRRDSDDWS